jgi:glutathione reductase (NADPH)
MHSADYDLFVIGAGSGGIRASRIAHHLGGKVAIAENYRIGGTCVIRGCIPKKLLAYAAHYAEDFEDARGYGWSIEGASFSWPVLIANKNREIARLSKVYTDGFAKVGIDVIEDTAKLVDAHRGDRRAARDGQNILVATGGAPVKPAIKIEHAITSNEAFELPALPGAS